MNKQYQLTYDDIIGIDLDISNICNLKCVLCPSIYIKQFVSLNSSFDKKFADIDLLISRFNKFKNLKTIQIAGAASEPTLYPKLFKLLDYINFRNLKVNLFTNANTHDIFFWKNLAKYMTSSSHVIFTVCGLKQSIHERYRVGSDLNKIISNILALKETSQYSVDHMQYIRFEYNKFETDIQIQNFAKQFSSYEIINTDVYERFQLLNINKSTNICSDYTFAIKYYNQLKKLQKKTQLNIKCNSFRSKIIQMDPFGNIFPCVCYRIFSKETIEKKKSILDYSDIISGKCNFCFECDEDNLNFLSKYSRDTFYMCKND